MTKRIPVLGLCGKAGSGKDTAADHLVKQYNFYKYALAAPIKEMLAVIGFDPDVYANREIKERVDDRFGVSYRKLAQTLGTEWARSLNPEFWLICAQIKYEQICQTGNYAGFVVSDVRFENEAAWVRGQGTLIHVTGRSLQLGAEESQHASEIGVLVRNKDLILNNFGTIEYMQGRLNLMVQEVFNV